MRAHLLKATLRHPLLAAARQAHWRQVHRRFPRYRVGPFTLAVFDASVGYSLNSPEALVADGVAGRRVLDVGVGNGIITLFAAHRGARSVLGVDVNPRAVENARFNLEDNGVTGVDVTLRVSDLYESVHGRFDLIVCNPPYYRFTATGQTARRSADPDMVPRLVAGAGAHLAPGGALRLLYPRADRAFIADLARQHGYALRTRPHAPAHSPQLALLRGLLRGPYRPVLDLHELTLA